MNTGRKESAASDFSLIQMILSTEMTAACILQYVSNRVYLDNVHMKGFSFSQERILEYIYKVYREIPWLNLWVCLAGTAFTALGWLVWNRVQKGWMKAPVLSLVFSLLSVLYYMSTWFFTDRMMGGRPEKLGWLFGFAVLHGILMAVSIPVFLRNRSHFGFQESAAGRHRS